VEVGQNRPFLVIVRCPFPTILDPVPMKLTSLRLAMAVLLLVGAAALTASPSGASDAATSDAAWARQVCKVIPADELLRTYNGYRPDRSGDIQFFAKAPDFVGSGLPHVGPWDYVQTVPMLWYGPGYFKPGVSIKRPVSLADIAPTQAQLLKTDFPTAVDGKSMAEGIDPAAKTKAPPKLIVTLIWDAGGMDALNEWPKAWPYLHSLMKQGTNYTNATVGTSPTSTAQDHATIGTGAFPMNNMLVAHHFRIGQYMTTPWAQGSRLLNLPTLGDIYDRANGNKPIIGGIGSVPIHLGMVSHGTEWGGGDKDVAIITNVNNQETLGQESPTWGLTDSLKPFYQTPEWVDPDGKPETVDYRAKQYHQAVDMVDRMDGKADGKWRDESIEELLGGFETPARIPWETLLVEDLVKRDGMGKDDTPDMLFVNYKVIDYVSHVWSMNSPYMEDSIKFQDDALRQLITFLDKEVGKDNYVINVTADHGSMPSPSATGAFVASPGKIGSAINNKFGDGTVMLTQNTTAFLDVPLLESNGYTVEDVARYVGTLTKGETYLEGGANYSPKDANEKLFSASFPSSLLPNLPCIQNAPLN
jgi:arylsulfatase A-like enzyme